MSDFDFGIVSFEMPTREAMHALGRRLATLLKGGDVVALEGVMGAGKTTLVQGIAWGLGLPAAQHAQSPTYPVALTYPTTPLLNHLDLYRIGAGAHELLGDSYFTDDAVTVIEWAALAPTFVPATFAVALSIEGDMRVAHFSANTDDAHARLFAWLRLDR